MSLVDALGLSIPVMFLVLLAVQALFPARPNPEVPRWRWIGGASFFGMMVVGIGLPLAIPPEVAAFHLLPGDRLGIAGGVVVGYLVQSFVSFLWHRACHAVPFLWRWSHQLHHSARRFDLWGGVLFHPVEMVAYTLVSVFSQVFLLGLHPVAAAGVGAVGFFYSVFQHLNVHTPTWLGYFIQRPESHAVHHQVGVHHQNFSDLPLWDLLFGTFVNPATYPDAEVGFGHTPSYLDMLAGRDVSGGEADGIPVTRDVRSAA